jgi:predicted lipoprotein with Yx(FWY)xxD motif
MHDLAHILLFGATALCGIARSFAAALPALQEDYVQEPMPPGFEVVVTELEGPVFADGHGKTLYKWPYTGLRNGYVGDQKGMSTCTGTVTTVSKGLFSPYPAGLVLPELDARRSCAAMWPPVLAPSVAQPVGNWSVITRADGSKQWAYDGQALYTSVLDHQPGDVLGGTNQERLKLTAVAWRYPVGPSPRIPPGFRVVTTFNGRLLVNAQGHSVYAYGKDGPDKSNCVVACLEMWTPVQAPALARRVDGDWTVIERAPGELQWSFRHQPLYTYTRDSRIYSQEGSDVPGWHNVYLQQAPPPPKTFQFVDTPKGIVVAEAQGKTVYTYACTDDSSDQLYCDYPGAAAAYRLSICGGGDAGRCLKTWPYVLADGNARSDNSLWSVMEIEPVSGRRAAVGEAGAMRVWAYRGRPIYTYAGDQAPGDIKGDMVGEIFGQRNGFTAMLARLAGFNLGDLTPQ